MANARCVVTFTMEYEAGAWGDDCPLGQLRDQALAEAKNAARRVVNIAAEHGRARLTVQNISTPDVIFSKDDR